MHLGRYDEAAKILRSLRTGDRNKKAKIFYDLGVCYEKMRRYDKARDSYAKAAALGSEKALGNMRNVIFKKRQKKQPLPFTKQKKIKTKTEGSDKKPGGSSNLQTALLGGNAKGGKKNSRQKAISKGKGMPMSSKVYEIINKGYIHEKRPW